MIDIITTSEGTRFAGFPNDHLFKEIKDGNLFADGFMKDTIARYVNPDSLCLDVGANLGYISLYLAKRARKVIAFEPQSVVYLQLCANIFLNEAWNITPVPVAAYSCACAMDFATHQSGWVGKHAWDDYNKITSIGSISLSPNDNGTMRAVRLDSHIKEKVDFIKVDAQGADIDVVLGCEGLIEKYRPVIVFEYEDDLSQINYGRSLQDIVPFVDKHNYDIKSLYEGNYLLTPK